MKFLWSKLSLGELYTDDTDNTNADDNDTDDNTTRRTKHDCIGSLPNEPKTKVHNLLTGSLPQTSYSYWKMLIRTEFVVLTIRPIG